MRIGSETSVKQHKVMNGLTLDMFRRAFGRHLLRAGKLINDINRSGPFCSGHYGFYVNILLREGSKADEQFEPIKQKKIDRALFDHGLDPEFVANVMSTFSFMTLLELHGEGIRIKELHIPRISRITDKGGFLRLNDHARVARMKELDIITYKAPTE